MVPIEQRGASFTLSMAIYTGRLQGPGLEPTSVTVETVDDQIRIATGRTHMGSWSLSDVPVQRTSIYRFSLEIEGDALEFFPEEPSEFSNAVGAVIDLTLPRGRFGLMERVQEARRA